MPKVIKSSIQNNFKGCPTLRVFQYENSKKYYCMFYVGGSFGTRGTIIRPTKEHNRKFAITKAKEEYRNFFLNNKKEDIKKNTFDFIKDIALPYFETRHKQYKVRDKNLAYVKKDKNRYLNYIKNFLDGIDYREEELMNTAILDLVDDLKERKMRKTTISKYMNSLSLMCKYGQRKGKMKAIPDIPTFTRINEEVPPYFPKDLKIIRNRNDEYYHQTEDEIYNQVNEYTAFLQALKINRAGLNSLNVKRSQFREIADYNSDVPIIEVKLFNTKNNPRVADVCEFWWVEQYWLKYRNKPIDEYMFAPEITNRERLYEKIRKTFVRVSAELNLYILNGKRRPLTSIRHTNALKIYEQTKSMDKVAEGLNTGKNIVKSNYLNYSDEWARNRFKALGYDKTKNYQNTLKSKNKVKKKQMKLTLKITLKCLKKSLFSFIN